MKDDDYFEDIVSEKKDTDGDVKEKPIYIKEHLDYLFLFIESEGSLNDVLTGYFKNIVDALCESKSKEFLTYFYKDDTIYTNYLKHMDSKSMVDILTKFVNLGKENNMNDSDESANLMNSESKQKQNLQYFHKRLEILHKLKDIIKCTNDTAVAINTMSIFNDFMHRFHSITNQCEIFDSFFMDQKVLQTF